MPELGATLHTLKKAKTKKPLVYALGGVRREKSLNFLTLVLTELLCLVQFGGKETQSRHLKSINMLSEVHGLKKIRKRDYFKDYLRRKIPK